MKNPGLVIGAIVLVVLAALLINSWSGTAGTASAFGDAVHTVRRDDMRISIVENGYLKAKNSLSLKPRFERRATITWLVEEGKEVEKDELLVEFDKTEMNQQIDELENRLIQAETELEAARAELEIQIRDNVTEDEKAALAVEVARRNLERYEQGDAPLELRRKELSLQKAIGQNTRAQIKLEQVPELLAEGFLTQVQVEEEEINARDAEIEKVTAEKDLELFKKYAYPMEMAKLRLEVRDAERGVERAKERAVISVKGKEARVTQQERAAKSTRTRLEKLKKEISHMEIRAPRAGIVHYGDPSRTWNRTEIKVGNQFSRGNTIITLPDLEEMQVFLTVHEADIYQVKEGQTALISLDTHKGKVFQGVVVKIATVASSSNWNDQNNKRFRVEIDMESSAGEMRAGITARVEILIDEIDSVLQIPLHAVHVEGDEHFCFVVDNRSAERRSIEIGRSSAHYVEILGGLEEGQQVLLYDPRDEGLASGEGADEDAVPDNPMLESGG